MIHREETKNKDTTKTVKSEKLAEFFKCTVVPYLYGPIPMFNSLVPEPKFTIIREPVEGEVPEFLVMEVELKGVVSNQLLIL